MQENQEHKQECEERNLMLQIELKYINLVGSSSLQMKGVIDIVKKEQEKGPDSQ